MIEHIHGHGGSVSAVGLSVKMLFRYLISPSSTMNADVAFVFSNIIVIQCDTLVPSASVLQVDKA